MDIDTDRVDEAVLALLYLGLHDGYRAWKGFDWDAMDRLHEKGFIGDPVGKAKSVVFTEEGLRESERSFRALFGTAGAGPRPAGEPERSAPGAPRPVVAIKYCRQCRWLLRAAWTAQELLTTFEEELGGVTLIPGTGGVFVVRVGGETVWSRKEEGRFPDIAELKQRVRDRVAPGRDLGHVDRRGRGAAEGG